MRETNAKSDDIDILKNRKSVTMNEFTILTGTGLKSANDLAMQAGAIFYIGKRKFVNVPKAFKYIDEISE